MVRASTLLVLLAIFGGPRSLGSPLPPGEAPEARRPTGRESGLPEAGDDPLLAPCWSRYCNEYDAVIAAQASGDRRTSLSKLLTLYADEEKLEWGLRPVVRRRSRNVAQACGGACLLTLIYLHQDVYALLREEGRLRAAKTAVEHSEILLERFHRRSSGPRDREKEVRARIRAGLLSRQVGDLFQAREDFEKVLELRPKSAVALRYLAALSEKLGEYDEARKTLHRLLDVLPGDPPTRLRLALIEGRTGRSRAAEKHLRQLLDAAGPRWAQVLAFEELARLRIEAGDLSGAREIVAQGQRRFPRQQGLEVLAVYVSGQRRRADEAFLDRLAARSRGTAVEEDGKSSAPRVLYNNWPREGVPEVIAALEEDDTESRLQLVSRLTMAGLVQ